MEMPDAVLCEKCGASAEVVTNGVDERALAGEMPPEDRRWDEGFFYAIDCPNCGVRMQGLAPPP
jgi:hypothetical protein